MGWAGAGNFSLHHRVQNGAGAHPASYLSSGVKWPGREADHSPPYSAEVTECVVYTSTPNTPSWRGAQLKKDSPETNLPLPGTPTLYHWIGG
jgi:hypothetical protein